MKYMPPSSTQIYDRLAPYYRHYSDKKSRYLAAIDELILNNIRHSGPTEYVLDIGCGDGIRGIQFVEKIKPKWFLMIDSSANMTLLANKFRNQTIDVMQADITDNESVKTLRQNYFDKVLCLWNVFGHIIEPHRRLRAILNIKNVMKENGMLFVDVSNRYNASHYGFKSVIRNMWQDIIHSSRDNGTFFYDIDVGTEKIPSHCHFFSPGEFPNLCLKAGLNIEKTIYVNYENGAIANRFGGHAFYVVKKKTPR